MPCAGLSCTNQFAKSDARRRWRLRSQAVMQDSKRLDDLSSLLWWKSSFNVVLALPWKDSSRLRAGFVPFWSLQSGPVGSRAAIRLLAGTEAMPPWDEGCRRADEKRLKVLRRTAGQPRAPKKRCKTQPIAHPSARKATRVPLIPPATAHDICAPRKPRYAKISGSTYRCDSCRSHSCELARADRRCSKSND